MIFGIGIDEIMHNRIDELGWLTDDDIQKRIFSNSERSAAPDHFKKRFFAGRFACKEAVLKCIKSGMEDGLALNEISVVNDNAGCPSIVLHGAVEKKSNELGIRNWHVSITHTENSSTAFVIAEI